MAPTPILDGRRPKARACTSASVPLVDLDSQGLTEHVADAKAHADPRSMFACACGRLTMALILMGWWWWWLWWWWGAWQRHRNNAMVRAVQGQGLRAPSCATYLHKMSGTRSDLMR